MGNRNLNAAAKAKNDEFYTQLTDIEKDYPLASIGSITIDSSNTPPTTSPAHFHIQAKSKTH